MTISDIQDPIERFVAFIEEREAIRLRRESGKPWPWTQEPILQTYRFTNINRENDRVSKHYQKTIRNRYEEYAAVFAGTMLYRWFNRETTCDMFFNQLDMEQDPAFEEYMKTRRIEILTDTLRKIPPPHVTGAYIITGKPCHTKGEGVLIYFHEWCKKPWIPQWDFWLEHPPLLEEMSNWIDSEGLGSFMRAQIVADLKYLPFMRNVEDWWTWASPGPGSQRGLNIILNQPIEQSWNPKIWLKELGRLNEKVTPMLEAAGIERMHNQDLQNCLCEFSKYTKVVRGIGRPRQVFHHI
jgi:hypothetical protein